MYNKRVTRSVSAELRAMAGQEESLRSPPSSQGISQALGGLGHSHLGFQDASGNKEAHNDFFLQAALAGSPSMSASGANQSFRMSDYSNSGAVNRMSSEELFQAWLHNNTDSLLGQERLKAGSSAGTRMRDDLRVSGELSSIIAGLQQQSGKRKAQDLLGDHWSDPLGQSDGADLGESSMMAQLLSNQPWFDKISQGAQQEETRGHGHRRNHSQLSSSSLSNSPLSNWLPSTPMTRSKSSELRRLVASTGSPAPSTDEILRCLANNDLPAVLASMMGSGGGGKSSGAANQRSPLVHSALLQQAINSVSTSPLPPRPRGVLNPHGARPPGGGVSAVVSRLKGNLERKKLGAQLAQPQLPSSPPMPGDLGNALGQLAAAVGSLSGDSGGDKGGRSFSLPAGGSALSAGPALSGDTTAELPTGQGAAAVSSGGGPSSGKKGVNNSKHNRVERTRKMIEAKGRNKSNYKVTPDAEALKKKCDMLETEVRSLKTFQSFMNRKDSEQTTKIEELEAKNAALIEERDRLIEQLNRFNRGDRDG